MPKVTDSTFLKFSELENGNLALRIHSALVAEVRESAEGQDNDYTWSELFEETMCNGSFTYFNAGHGNPFVGLTEAPCIAESMDITDSGENVIEGNFWFFGAYCVTCPLEKLLNGETVIFTKA